MAIDCMLLQVCSRIEYISTLVTNKTQGLCPQYGTHVCVQQCSLPELLLTESTFYKYLSCDKCGKTMEMEKKHIRSHMHKKHQLINNGEMHIVCLDLNAGFLLVKTPGF